MSWKKSGGIDTYERTTNIKAKSIVTDNIVVKDSFLSDFVIEGTMTVKDNTFLRNELDVSSNVIMRRNLDVSEDLHLGNRLYLTDNDTFIKGGNYRIGINKNNPSSTLDIVSNNNSNGLNIYTNTIQNRNILARNNIDNGMAFFVDGSNVSTIQFYNKNSSKDASGLIIKNGVTSDIANISSHAKIEYSNSEKKLKVKGSQMENMEIISRLLVSSNEVNHNFQETAVIYDTESLDLYPNINSYSGSKYGNSLSLYGNNNNNITFLNMLTNDKGLYIGGGNYPIDVNKSMGIIDLKSDTSSIPAQIMVNGSNNYHKILGFNTYEPNTDNLVNINGPTYITNDNINSSISVNYEIIDFLKNNVFPDYSIACGSSSALFTIDEGSSWQTSAVLSSMSNAGYYIHDGIIFDSTKSIVSSKTGGFLYYSNTRNSYTQFTNGIPTGEYVGLHIYRYSINTNYIYYAATNILVAFTFDWTNIPTTTTTISSLTINNSIITGTQIMKGYENILYLLKLQIIEKYEISNINPENLTLLSSSPIMHVNNTISINERNMKMKVYDENTVVFTDETYVHGTVDGGVTWNSFQLRSLKLDLLSSEILNINIFDNHRAVIVGDDFFAYSVDGFVVWRAVTKKNYNSTGLGYLLENKRLSSVYIPNGDEFYLSDYNNSQTTLRHLFSPSLINFQYTSVIETLGSIHARGDVLINEGGLRTNDKIFNILPDSHNLLNIGKNTSQINIANSSLVVDPSKVTIQTSETTNTFTENLDVSENAVIKNLVISDELMVNSGQLDASVNNFNLLTQQYDLINIGTNTSTVNVGKDTINIGDGNSNIFFNGRIKGDLIVDGSFVVQTSLEQQGDLQIDGDLIATRDAFLVDVSMNSLIVSNQSNLSDVSMTNLEVLQDTKSQNLSVINSTTLNSLQVDGFSTFNQNVNVNGTVTMSGLNATTALITNTLTAGTGNINNINSTNGNIDNINSNTIDSDNLTVNDASINILEVHNDASFNSDVIIKGGLDVNNDLTVQGTVSSTGFISETNTGNLFSDKSYSNVYIATDASNIQIGSSTSTIVMTGSESASDTTGVLTVTSNAYIGYAEEESVPTTGNLAYFKGNIEVVGNNTAYLPNVESNNILSNTIDTTNAYVSEKLYFGYSQDDLTLPILGIREAYFNGDVTISGTTKLDNVESVGSSITMDNINLTGTISQW